jgi:hypothetical protein
MSVRLSSDVVNAFLSVFNGPMGWILLAMVLGFIAIDRWLPLPVRGQTAKQAVSDGKDLYLEFFHFASGVTVLLVLIVGFKLFLQASGKLPRGAFELTVLDDVLISSSAFLWVVGLASRLLRRG